MRLRRLPRDSGRQSDRADARQALLDEVSAQAFWFHSIELGGGVVTPGLKTREQLASELESLRLPDLAGRTVLDIGSWDGFFAFEAERRGAARVVALDRFVWAWDHTAGQAEVARQGPHRRRNAAGRLPAQDESLECWDPVGLPGKRPFDLARQALRSHVQPVVADFVADDLSFLGTFDVVLFLGVLYHMQDPLGALRRLAQLTAGTAVIETEARVFAGNEMPLCEYLGGHRLLDDPTNWWAPNESALRLMLLEAGFSNVESIHPAPDPPAADEPVRYRAILHACKPGAG